MKTSKTSWWNKVPQEGKNYIFCVCVCVYMSILKTPGIKPYSEEMLCMLFMWGLCVGSCYY